MIFDTKEFEEYLKSITEGSEATNSHSHSSDATRYALSSSRFNKSYDCPVVTKPCYHKNIIKKPLLTSFYHVCKDCGQDMGD